MRHFTIIFFCLLFSYQAAISQTTINGSYLFGGILREYKIYIPALYNASKAVPLVINLHGYTSNNAQQEFYADFRPIADTANFIIVHPNGTLDFQNNQYWNCFGLAQPDDVGFLNSLMDTLKKNYSIDTNRIYSTGMSNGGFMSYELACKSSHRIAAIASVTGSMVAIQQTNCTPSHPMPVMQIHGTADPTVSYDGTAGILASVHIDSLVKYWVTFNQCNPIPVFNNVADLVTSDLCTAVHYVYNNGLKGSTVEFYKIIGGTHTWPGAPINIGVTNMDFSASKEIWRFFNQYKLNNLLTEVENTIPKTSFRIYPNPSHGKIQVQINESRETLIEIYALNGQRMYSEIVHQSSCEVDFPKQGIYLLRCISNGQSYQEKILIEK